MPTTLNNQALPNGVNIQPSFYNAGNVNFAWDLMKTYPAIKTVRIEIEPNSVIPATTWIAEAQGNGYFVIATYHKSNALGSNDPQELILAAQWWADNYQTLGGNFIINLTNEWGAHNLSSTEYADAYNPAIELLRTVYGGDIIIDLPGWGQDAGVAADAIAMITDSKIALSAHIYKDSWNGSATFSRQDIRRMLHTGKPCIVGEFGPIENQPGTGHCDWADCVKYAKSKGMTVLGWCWNGDGQDHNMVSPNWLEDPLPTDPQPNAAYFNQIYSKLVGI
ncbi:MAG: cellulase family glycosylhydrolase [Bacteroidetes bacterium]|nr:cellulase family glycosylhydrolase [Bacteroidota bacterium]